MKMRPFHFIGPAIPPRPKPKEKVSLMTNTLEVTVDPIAKRENDWQLLDLLDTIEAEPRVGVGGRSPAFTADEVRRFYAKHAAGVSWATINKALNKIERGEKRAGSLAHKVHLSAERHGIPVQITPRPARTPKAEVAS